MNADEPAFPSLANIIRPGGVGFDTVMCGGLTKRELITAILLSGEAKAPGETCDEYMKQRVNVARRYADYLLAELAKGEK